MRILFYLGHPAHFHLFKHVVGSLEKNGHHVQVVIKAKDVLKDLLEEARWTYEQVHERGPKKNKLDFAVNLFKRDVAVYRIAKEFKPELMLGTSAEITHVGKLLGIKSIVVNEDDFEVVPWFGRLAYPFATAILAPSVCSVGRWGKKKIPYEGYHELAYLHPDHFTPDKDIQRQLAPHGERYFILRFAQLTAHHDVGRKGISAEVANYVIRLLEPHGNVYITSERKLEEEFEGYRIAIDPALMHSALQFASLYIGDSQTMAAEAAVLGTPSIRFNDFVGEISYLDELEHRYGLTYGIATDFPDRLFQKIQVWMRTPDLSEEWKRRKNIMLSQKIDVAHFMSELIQNYGRPSPAQLVTSEVNQTPLFTSLKGQLQEHQLLISYRFLYINSY